MKKHYVASLQEGARIEEVFLVASKSVASTRSGAPFLKVKLTDKTGTVDAIKWDATDAEIAKLCEDDYVVIHGTVKTYNGEPQVTIESFGKCGEQVDPTDFLACCVRDPQEMMSELSQLLATVTNPHLKCLLDSFFGDECFASRFAESPAATKIHHAYIGGLLEHTLGVVRACAALAELYPQADRDLLVVAAALHDIGKVEEFAWSGAIRYSNSGNLVGHLVGGAMMVRDAAAKIDGFDPMLSMALQHAVLSHHGKLEYGSPKEPRSIEALIVHYADELDARVIIYQAAINESNRTGEPGLFTKRHSVLNHNIFRGLPVPGNGGDGEESADLDLFAADMDFDPFAE